jgi:hypothetical protein
VKAGQANDAAKRLQDMGFRILHIGGSISVEAPAPLWERTFGVTFRQRTTRRLPAVAGSAVTYQEPVSQSVTVPAELRDVVTGVAFARPPEFF